MTTTVAIKCNDGVALAADRRASKGFFVGSKDVHKIYTIDDNTAVAVAGQLSDAEYVINLVKAERRLAQLRRGFPLNIKESAKLFSNIAYHGLKSYQPYFAELLVAGNDKQGSHVFSSDISGSIISEEFTSSGSGSPIAYGVLEGGYKPNMTLADGKELAVKAVRAAMERDPGSGNGVDLTTIPVNGTPETISLEAN